MVVVSIYLESVAMGTACKEQLLAMLGCCTVDLSICIGIAYHASTPPLSLLQAGCPTSSVKALKE